MMFSSAIIYLELFIALFFLPGFFITVILGIKKLRFLLSVALSYALLVLTLLPFEYYAQPIVRWQWCVLSVWVILAALAVAKMFMPRNSKTLNIQHSTTNVQHPRDCFRFKLECWKLSVQNFIRLQHITIHDLLSHRLLVPLALAGIICGYLAYAGPYLEIPSDVWEHVRRSQWIKLSVLDNEYFPSGLSLEHFVLPPAFAGRHYGYWDFIRAWLCQTSGLPVMDSVHALTFVNVLTFLLAIYYFGLFLFSGLRVSAFKKMIMAALASLFAATNMGNMVFAYIRYYAFASTILNYVIFLAAMSVIIARVRSGRRFGSARHRWLGHAAWIAPVLVIVTGMIHTQETLFIFFMTLALGIVEMARIIWRKISSLAWHSRNQNVIPAKAGIQVGTFWIPIFMGMTKRIGGPVGQTVRGNRWTAKEWKAIILTVFLFILFFAGFAVIRHFKPGAWISNNMIMPHVAIPSEPVNFIFRNLLISPPHNPWFRLVAYQLFVFYQVVGCWGLFVYLLFALMIRRFVKIPYLIAGMLVVPLLTIFNPLTIDMMARVGQDMALYRFIYLIPLPFAGGYLFVHFWGKAREWFQKMRAAPRGSVPIIWPRLSWLNFVGCVLVLSGLIGLIFPINAAGIYAPYSKIYTLRKIPAANDYHLFDDLGKIMAQYEKKIILTDGWTAGYLWLYSPENTYCNPKWLNSSNPENEPPEPYAWEKLSNRGLIVINRRNGAPSITGRIAKHWPEDVLQKVSRNYSHGARHYLESHPEKFRKIWDQNRIAVYAVR